MKSIAAKAKSPKNFFLKCSKKIRVSLQVLMPVKMAQYSSTARAITLVISVQKMKSGLLPKMFP